MCNLMCKSKFLRKPFQIVLSPGMQFLSWIADFLLFSHFNSMVLYTKFWSSKYFELQALALVAILWFPPTQIQALLIRLHHWSPTVYWTCFDFLSQPYRRAAPAGKPKRYPFNRFTYNSFSDITLQCTKFFSRIPLEKQLKAAKMKTEKHCAKFFVFVFI